MRIENPKSKVLIYLALGIGAVIALLITVFGASLFFGCGFFGGCDTRVPEPLPSLLPTPTEPTSDSPHALSAGDRETCQKIYAEIKLELAEANYCKTNSDCTALQTEAGLAAFDCHYYVNKEVNKTFFHEKMRNYFARCASSGKVHKCASAPEAVCIQNKCQESSDQANQKAESSASAQIAKLSGTQLFVGKQAAIGQNFNIESTFAPEAYNLKVSDIAQDGTIKLEYNKAYLGRPCSTEEGAATIKIPLNGKQCLMSTICDAGEEVCFENLKVKEGIEIQYTVTEYDGEDI